MAKQFDLENEDDLPTEEQDASEAEDLTPAQKAEQIATEGRSFDFPEKVITGDAPAESDAPLAEAEDLKARGLPKNTPTAHNNGPRDQTASIAEYNAAMNAIPGREPAAGPVGAPSASQPAPVSDNQELLNKLAALKSGKAQPGSEGQIDQLLQARKDAQNTAFQNSLKERLIDTGATAGGLQYKQNTALGDDAIKNADLDIQNVTERPALQMAQPDSDASEAFRSFLKQKFPTLNTGNASADTLMKLLPALRSFGVGTKDTKYTNPGLFDSKGAPVFLKDGILYRRNTKTNSFDEVPPEEVQKIYAPKNAIDQVTGNNISVQGSSKGGPKVSNISGPSMNPEEAAKVDDPRAGMNPKQRTFIDNMSKQFALETKDTRAQVVKAGSIAKEIEMAVDSPAGRTELSTRIGKFLTGGKITQNEAMGLFLHRSGALNRVNDYLAEATSGTLPPDHAKDLVNVFKSYAQDAKQELAKLASEKAMQFSNNYPQFKPQDVAPLIFGRMQSPNAKQAVSTEAAVQKVKMQAPDGSVRLIPKDKIADAIKHGGKLLE